MYLTQRIIIGGVHRGAKLIYPGFEKGFEHEAAEIPLRHGGISDSQMATPDKNAKCWEMGNSFETCGFSAAAIGPDFSAAAIIRTL